MAQLTAAERSVRHDGDDKYCPNCEQWANVDGFRTLRNGTLRSICRDCERAYSRRKSAEYHAVGATRSYHLKRKFGMSVAEYEAMLIAQGGACAISQRPERRRNRAGTDTTRQLAVDHDHSTGKVRALLCHDCNVAIGLMDENPELLQQASAYLSSHSHETEGGD